MTSPLSVRILELMASKICHDLISPVGAVSNGVEILEEMGAEAGEDVTSLIAFSAAQANAKLKTLRMAYGLGGADSAILPEEVHTVFGDFIAGEKRVTQDWDPHRSIEPQSVSGYAKILVCALILATETLPKGGEISVSQEEDTIIVSAEGEKAHFKEGYLSALEGSMEEKDMEPKFAHAYITGLLSRHYSFEFSVDDTKSDFISLRIKIPNL